MRSALVSQPSAAVGESGLDRVRLDTPWEAQLSAFALHVRLASELRRALVVHAVRADGALLDLLRAEATAGTLPPVLVMHAFGGSAETAANLLRLGAEAETKVFFGFSERAVRLRRAPAVIQSVPESRLLLESDEHIPDQALRAVASACERLAAVRAWSLAQAAEQTAENAREAFEPSGWGSGAE